MDYKWGLPGREGVKSAKLAPTSLYVSDPPPPVSVVIRLLYEYIIYTVKPYTYTSVVPLHRTVRTHAKLALFSVVITPKIVAVGARERRVATHWISQE